MRDRTSSDNDDRPKPASTTPSASDKAKASVKSRDMIRDGGSGSRSRLQERKQSRELSVSPVVEGHSPLMRTSISSPALEKNPLLETPPTPIPHDAPAPIADHVRQHAARLPSPWRCSFLTLATSMAALLLLFTIVHSFLNRQQDPKGCAMSYMMPRFNHFADFDTEHTRFASKYSLYLYREGGVDDDVRVKGIPVLFIPGNAGSYKQVRPIAAEAARYFHDTLRMDGHAIGDGKRPLDFFTVDFNEELIAFHGQTLLDQAEYLNEAVAYILALYHQPQRSLREPGLPDPKSVIILGHSMGGVVARTMLRMPNYQEKTINTIITLSAPHARPPISFDPAMVETYNDVNTFWRDAYSGLTAGKSPLDDVTLVSVAGGGLDTMIPSEYTSLTSLVPDTHGFTVFTSSIPNVWTGMDHLAIMWCDQFRKALVRAIFDVIDVRRPGQTQSRPERIRAFRKRLLTGMEPVVEKGLLEKEPNFFLTLEHSSTAIMSHGERLVLRSLGDTGTTKAHVMPVPAQPFVEGSKFTLLTDQTLDAGEEEGTLSVLLCSVFPPPSGFAVLSYAINLDSTGNSAGSTRLACKNAASDVSLLPASTNTSVNAFDNAKPFSYLQYDLHTVADYQFVAVLEKAKERQPGWVMAEFSQAAAASIQVNKGHHQILMGGLKVKLPKQRPMMTEIKIPEVHSTLFAYSLQVKQKKCDKYASSFAPLMRQYIAEPYESKYFVNTKGGNINVHGLSPYMPPPLLGGGATEGLSLQLWTDPTCNSTVEVSLKVDKLGSAGKLVMRYRTVFAAFPLLVVALVLRKQFKVYDTTGVFMSFTQSMDQCIRTSLPAIFIALTFFGVAVSKSSHNIWTRHLLSTSTGTSEQTIDFTVNDLMLGTSDPFFWFLVPLFAIIAVGICIAMNYIVLILEHVFALIFSCVRAWTQRTVDEHRRSQGPLTATQRLVTTGILVLMVVTVIPYQFAYMVLCIVQVATCIRALKGARDTQSAQSYNFYNYTHSMLVLMLWILPINMPVLVVWIHNLAVHWLTPFSTHHNLLCVLGYILLVEMMSTNNMIPRVTNRSIRLLTNTIMFIFAIYAASYGVTYAYMMHYFVNALCLWFFVIHLSSGPVSLANLVQYITGADGSSSSTTSKGKKRP
ncbi:GPI inositol-deacylase [Fulvia fulva]|nr:GPI inositol-deacylase [Fulvia fulva]WPV11947.1 GPI inositol-deacylase [Fulvia fulva]WPV26909.1 GPI inositol-deacylase [Fulvia fulva]